MDKNSVKKILVVSLSNIGDVILTLPVVDVLIRDFTPAKVSLVIGPKAATLFKENPNLGKIFIFDKHQPLSRMAEWTWALRKENFDLVVDLRNTALPLFLGARYHTPFFMKKEKVHMKDKHLGRLKTVYDFKSAAAKTNSLFVPAEDRNYVDGLLKNIILGGERMIAIAPGAASQNKRWNERSFAETADYLINNFGAKIIFLGDEADSKVAQNILSLMRKGAFNLCGKTTLIQAAELLNRSSLAIVNDSALMHLASYLDLPVLAIFGPTDPKLYGPWSSNCSYLADKTGCPACADRRSQLEHTCIANIKSNSVINRIAINQNKVSFKTQ